MEPVVERCCGLDVHQETVVACLLVGSANEKPRKELKTFKTFTRDLEALRDWLVAERCTQVAMESTGSYWVPVYAVLEKAAVFELVVGNAAHIKNVPGRKTDVKDAEWIADLLRHGLIRKSFVPPKPLRDLRDLLRYRRSLVNSRSAERNRLLKLLETANIKLANVASDVFGVSGMLMLKALLDGRQTPEQMAQLAKKTLRRKIPELTLALMGDLDEHHRMMLGVQLTRMENADKHIEQLDDEIDRRLEPYRDPHQRLMEIPGVDWVVAATLIAEIGVDMTVFPTKRHLAAWAGVSPGNNESAGKHKPTGARKGNVHLKSALVQAAHGAAKTKGSYLRDKYFRLRARRGAQKAALAIAHKQLTAAWHMLSTGRRYNDLGDTFLDKLDKSRVTNNLVRRLNRLGYAVELREAAA